ncbi:hypothetical protein CWE15_04305 [Aliidiomarina taiwanensis]|uniref:Uncharacterized protein n=1 Tax=Aliidiomarina taiwanensis TaxID=946228 RepID=A0A432XAH3_9GAMM|nr:hypothetical protein [Aliidiomarina taiwanensis]RUO44403.1 hypothetical protein CWE15_04305 [Aliidiomarina taiwanensis]
MTQAGTWKVLLMCSLLFYAATCSGVASAASELKLEGPLEPVAEGYFQLHINEPQHPPDVVIEQSSTPSFQSITARYSPMGDFQQISLSGFASGDYYFRARSQEMLSNTVHVVVAHHSLQQAFTLFFIGAALFAVLVLCILRYHRLQQKQVTTHHD